MKHCISYKLATKEDAALVKSMTNAMYRSNYETREEAEIGQAIDSGTEIYVLANRVEKCVGFCGAAFNDKEYEELITPETAIIEKIFVDIHEKEIITAYKLINLLLNELVKRNVEKAIMQVQTFNKQRFFHYALSNKKILKSTTCTAQNRTYQDEILLIENIKAAADMSATELIRKAHFYLLQEKS